MTRKSGNKWMTMRCGRCGQAHTGYSGKLDEDGIEYVVCGETNKRMDVDGSGPLLFFTTWILQEDKPIDKRIRGRNVFAATLDDAWDDIEK